MAVCFGSSTEMDIQRSVGSQLLSVIDVAGTISYVYDENGNVLKVTDENGSILRTYDELNWVKTHTDTNGYTIQYTYNTMGALQKCRNELVRSGDILYTYDAEGNRSRQENVATGEVLTYATDSNSELSRVLQVRKDTGNSEDGENSGTISIAKSGKTHRPERSSK